MILLIAVTYSLYPLPLSLPLTLHIFFCECISLKKINGLVSANWIFLLSLEMFPSWEIYWNRFIFYLFMKKRDKRKCEMLLNLLIILPYDIFFGVKHVKPLKSQHSEASKKFLFFFILFPLFLTYFSFSNKQAGKKI